MLVRVTTEEAPDAAAAGEPVQGRRKSDHTKAAILAAARNQFAADGYRGASVRAIAAEAHIDPSMVIRYFESKEKLFQAAIDVDLRLPDLAGVPREEWGHLLAAHFLERWEGALADNAVTLLLRSAVTHGPAAEQVRRVVRQQVGAAVAPFVDETELPRRVGLAVSQILGLALTRYILRVPGVADADPATLVADLGPTLRRYLTEPLPSPVRRAGPRA